MGMKLQDVMQVMDRFQASGLAHMKLSLDGCQLELDRTTGVAAPVVAPVVTADTPVVDATSAPSEPDGPCITAPVVGTFYVAPSPESDPFVQPGDKVKAGDTVCLLEAMKMMSEVTAPCDCVIDKILAADGELVEFGAPLMSYHQA